MMLRLIHLKEPLDPRFPLWELYGSTTPRDGLFPGGKENAAPCPSEVRRAELRGSQAGLVPGRAEVPAKGPRDVPAGEGSEGPEPLNSTDGGTRRHGGAGAGGSAYGAKRWSTRSRRSGRQGAAPTKFSGDDGPSSLYPRVQARFFLDSSPPTPRAPPPTGRVPRPLPPRDRIHRPGRATGPPTSRVLPPRRPAGSSKGRRGHAVQDGSGLSGVEGKTRFPLPSAESRASIALRTLIAPFPRGVSR